MSGLMLIFVVLHVLMIGTAIGLIYWYARFDRAGGAMRDVWAGALLGNLALLAAVSYFNVSIYPKPALVVHSHDIFHYYVGAKYSPELGYLDLYPATVLADTENGEGRIRLRRLRDMESYEIVAAAGVVDAADEYRGRFSAERWEEFKSDVDYFHAKIADATGWGKVVRDKGYNATPVWNMVAYYLTNGLSTRNPVGIPLLVSLDIVFLVAMFWLISQAFGRRAALFAVVFFGTVFMMAPGHISLAFLRLDWLALLVMATCLLKMGRYGTAGGFVAYAGMVRIFPLIFAFGLGAKCLWDLLSTRRLDRRRLRFLLAFAIVAAALFALSAAHDGGLDGWRAFSTKIQLHDEEMSFARVGFKNLFLMMYGQSGQAWDDYKTVKQQQFRGMQGLWWTLQAAILAVSFFAVRRLEDYETLPFSFVLVYFLAAPTFYYHVMLVVPLLLFLPKLHERRRAHGAALLFAVSIVGYAAYTFSYARFANLAWSRPRAWPEVDLTITFVLACLLFVVSLYVAGMALGGLRTTPRPPPR